MSETFLSVPALVPAHADPSRRPAVCMFVRNRYDHDSRVKRMARALHAEGFAVTVFCVGQKPADAGIFMRGDIRVHRLFLGKSAAKPPIRARATVGMGRALRLLLVALYHFLALVRSKYRSPLPYERRTKRFLRGVLRTAAPRLFGKVRKRRSGNLPAVAPAPKPISSWRRTLARFYATQRFGRVAAPLAAELKPVAYHCHDLNAVFAGWRARLLHKAPLIYDAHELWPHRNRPDASKAKTWTLERADRYVARRVEAIITVNETIAEHMRREYGATHVNVVRNAPPLKLRGTVPDWARMDDIPHPRILYLGGVTTHRGIQKFIRALPLIPKATLVAVGPTNGYRAELDAAAVEVGVTDRVRFIPAVPEESVVATAAQADIGLSLIQNRCLSYYYSLPNKMFEYIHAGVPILASDFPELGRIVKSYQVGETCNEADPASIAKAVNDMLARPRDLERMRKNARIAAEELNWESERATLIDVYRLLIEAQDWPMAEVSRPFATPSPTMPNIMTPTSIHQ